MFRKVKRFLQRILRGYDDSMLWNPDDYIAEYALPLLKSFREAKKHGYPSLIKAELGYAWDDYSEETQKACTEHWDWVIGELIFFFDKEQWDYSLDQEVQERFQKAQERVGKYFWNLWD